MIATDPLSLIFLGCIIFSGLFLVVSSVSGLGHGHGLHLGGHALGHVAGGHVTHVGGHAGHVNHVGQAGHATHAGQAGNTHASAHAGPTGSSAWLGSFVHAFESSLNLYGLLVFLLIFGLLGYLLHNSTNLVDVATVVLALAVGAGSAMVVSLLMARLFFLNGPPLAIAEDSQLEGRLGQVSMAIREGGIGEVIYTTAAGSRHSVGARSADGMPIARDTDVVVLGYKDGIATVQPWDRFMASTRAGNTPLLEAIDQAQ
jgi:hypothetical protein